MNGIEKAEIARLVFTEIDKAEDRFGPFRSSHEALGVLLEEFDELKEAIQRNDRMDVQAEAIQVAAVAMRLADRCMADAPSFLERSGMDDG